jgi:CHASE2 domain-containing sensor protein
MSLVYATAAATGWLVCGWIPMILGLLVMGLAWWSRYATWLHLRVHEGDGRRVAISLPVPLTLAAWVLRIARPFVPQLENTAVDEVILALRDSKTGDQPLMIDIDDEESGEKVQIYFG